MKTKHRYRGVTHYYLSGGAFRWCVNCGSARQVFETTDTPQEAGLLAPGLGRLVRVDVFDGADKDWCDMPEWERRRSRRLARRGASDSPAKTTTTTKWSLAWRPGKSSVFTGWTPSDDGVWQR